jgi:hypothetical protein
MPRGRRLLASSATALVGAVAAGRWVARWRRAGDPGTLDHDLLGSARGRPRTIRGPLGSRIYTETLAAGPGSLVFTHGWCVSEAIWHHQKEALVAGPHRRPW